MNYLERSLCPYKTTFTKKRVGPDSDSGYVIPVELLSKCQELITFGVGGNIDFEKQIANDGMPVRCYDQEPNYDFFPQLKDVNVGDTKEVFPNVSYCKKFVTAENINDIVPNHPHFLKMDIENAEWGVLRALNVEKQKQAVIFVVEFHINNEYRRTSNLYSVIDVLLKLNNTHKLIHVHGNNYESFIHNTKIPNVLECTYINKQFDSTKEIDYDGYPSVLDKPCNILQNDLRLDWWSKNG